MTPIRAILLIGIMALVAISPALAEMRTVPQGGAIFIGENHLNIASLEGTPAIGWWASRAAVGVTPPTKTISLAGRYNDFSVTPGEFSGYTGFWNAIDPTTGYGTYTNAFTVDNPTIDVRILDSNNQDQTGKTILPGTPLRLFVETNLFLATKRLDANSATDNTINVKVTGPNGIISTNDVFGGNGGLPYTTVELTPTTDGIYSVKVSSSLNGIDVSKISTVTVASPTPIPTATPVPTPSTGSIVVQSNPAGASIFVDNAIRGITPLTVHSIPNGEHTVLIRLNGYEDSRNSIVVLSDTQTISPTLVPLISSTTSVTTIQTTAFVATPTPTIMTQTPVPTTTTPTVNYSATIAAMQSQIAEQNTKILEQESWIDQILKFLGLR